MKQIGLNLFVALVTSVFWQAVVYAQVPVGQDKPALGPLRPAASIEDYKALLPNAVWTEGEAEFASELVLTSKNAVQVGEHRYDVKLVRYDGGEHNVVISRLLEPADAAACEEATFRLIEDLEIQNGAFTSIEVPGSPAVMKCFDTGTDCPNDRRNGVFSALGSEFASFSLDSDGLIFKPEDAADPRISLHHTFSGFKEDPPHTDGTQLIVSSIMENEVCALRAFMRTGAPQFAYTVPDAQISIIQRPTIGAIHNALAMAGLDLTKPLTITADCFVSSETEAPSSDCRNIRGAGLRPDQADAMKLITDLYVINRELIMAEDYTLAVFPFSMTLQPSNLLHLKTRRPVKRSLDSAEEQGFSQLIVNRDQIRNFFLYYVFDLRAGRYLREAMARMDLRCVVQADLSLACDYTPNPEDDPRIYDYFFTKASMFLAPKGLVGRTVQLTAEKGTW